MRNILLELFEEATEEEVQASMVLQDLCIQNDLVFPEQLYALQYFEGIEPGLIISKVNALNTPLIENAMFEVH